MATTFYPLFHSNLWSNWKQGANIWNIHQLAAWPVPHACAQPYHPAVAAMDSCLALTDLTGTHQHGISSRQSYECTKPCFHGCQSTAWFMLLWVQFACCRNAPESFLKAYPLDQNGNSRDHRFRPRLHGETLPRVKGSLATLGEPRASQLSIPRHLHKKQKAGTARSVPRLDLSTCHPFVMLGSPF